MPVLSSLVRDHSSAEQFSVFREVVIRLGSNVDFDGHRLPPFTWGMSSWLDDRWLACVTWELTEMEFRHELFALDELLRALYPASPELHGIPARERRSQLFACWGGGGFKPDDDKPSAFSSDVKSPSLLAALHAMLEFMSVWPRSAEHLSVPKSGWSLDSIDGLAVSVWGFYAQTYYDYRRQYPPLPFFRPPTLS